MTGQISYDTPACWDWPPPSDDMVARLGRDSDLLWIWQNGRCAACGINPTRNLVEDHDHNTGLIRGYLCRSCNVREGRGGGGLLAQYRERNPASILGVEEVYVNIYGQTPMRAKDWTDEEFEEIAAAVAKVFGE